MCPINSTATILTPDPTLPLSIQMKADEQFRAILPWYPHLKGGVPEALATIENLMDDIISDINDSRK